MSKKDTRIVCGVRCSWWGSIYEVVKNELIPTCPKCNGPLYEVSNLNEWNKYVRLYDKTHEEYMKFIEWVKGKCYPNYSVAMREYTEETGMIIENLDY